MHERQHTTDHFSVQVHDIVRRYPFIPYGLKCVFLMALLVIVSILAPIMPPWLIPIISVIYALISTIGALYQVVIKRKHRQYKLAEEGQLSRLNRHWLFSLIIYFFLALVSAFVFLLEAPKWEPFEWILVWLTIPLFYIIFVFVKKNLASEYKRWTLKAMAMRWSFVIAAIILCLVYALASLGNVTSYASLSEACASIFDPYAFAPSLLLSDLSYVTSFTDGLVAFGTSQASSELSAFLIVGYIVQFVTFASVIFGMINQFCFCLLNKFEIASVFRLLPDTHQRTQDMPYQKRYFVCLAVMFALLFGLFLGTEHAISQSRNESDSFSIRTFIDDRREEAIHIADGGFEEYQDLKERFQTIDDQALQIEQLLSERQMTLEALINEYYDNCIDHVDAYVDWYYEEQNDWFKRLLRFFGKLSAQAAAEHFKALVIDAGNSTGITDAIEAYNEQIDSYLQEFQDTMADSESSLGVLLNNLKADDSFSLDLWSAFDQDESAFAEEYLIPADDESEEEFRDRLKGAIEAARQQSLEVLSNPS